MGVYSAPNTAFSNENLNALGSNYASLNGKDTNKLIRRITENTLFDASPSQFFDLKMLGMVKTSESPSDEFFYQEQEYQRHPLVVAVAASGVSSPTAQVVTLLNTDYVHLDQIVTYPNNSKGTVTNIDKGANQITVTPLNGQTLPSLGIGEVLANHSPVEADAMDGFTAYFRMQTVERYNYIQLMHIASRFGRVEMKKYQNAGAIQDYLSQHRMAMAQQMRINYSNVLWNGDRAEATLANGQKAKTTGGIFPTMVSAGSPNASTTTSTLRDAFHQVVDQTHYGNYGQTKMCFMDNELVRILSEQYKGTGANELIRYKVDDTNVMLPLTAINIGSVNAVLVPFKRFSDGASFPASFKNRIFIVDPDNLERKWIIPENSGTIEGREAGNARSYVEEFIEGSMGLKFNNPKSFGYVDVIR